MNSIEQFFSFLATLYTPRRAAITVFMVIGITLCLILLGPLFNYLLTPVLKPVTANYLVYITLLNSTLGIGLSVVFFSSLEYFIQLCKKLIEHRTRLKELKESEQKKQMALEKERLIFVERFTNAFEFIDEGHLELLRHLAVNGNYSLLNTSERVVFLRNEKWINAIAQANKHESVYEINPLIKELVETDWKEERDSLVKTALQSPEQALKDILNWFSLDNTDEVFKIKHSDFFASETQTILRLCFTCNGSLKNMTIMFQNHYKEAFEAAIQKKMKNKILITVYSETSYDHSSDLIF
ncbi:hypothetical protein ACMSZN_000813 [Cronobacter dublinensis]